MHFSQSFCRWEGCSCKDSLAANEAAKSPMGSSSPLVKTDLPSCLQMLHPSPKAPNSLSNFHLTSPPPPTFSSSSVFAPTMAPRTSTAQPAESPYQPASLTKYEIPAHQAKYIVTAPEMEKFLQRTFGSGLDFNISVRRTDLPCASCV